MKKLSLNNFINPVMFLYILSLYIFTYQEGLNLVSNGLAFLLITLILINFLLTRRKLVLNKFMITYIIFLLISLTSVFFAVDQSIAIIKFRTLFLLMILIIALINYIDTYEKLNKFIIYFVYSGLIASLYILLNSDFSQTTRFGSELGNVNAMGMIIGISATFCFYYILEKKKFRYLLYFAIMLIVILLTGSRKALLFIIANLVIILYLRNRKSFNSKIKFILISLILLLFAFYLIFNVPLFYQIVGKRIENMFLFIQGQDVNEGSVYARTHMITSGFEIFKDRPLTGYGLDNYRVLYNLVPGGRATYAHNNIIELMVDTGIFGVFMYYLSHFFILKDLLNLPKIDRNKTLNYAFIAIIVTYAALSIALIYYDSKQFSILIAVASIASRVVKLDKSKNISKT